jgi:hypothetical protein
MARRAPVPVDYDLMKTAFQQEVTLDAKCGYVESFRRLASRYNELAEDTPQIAYGVALRACRELDLDLSKVEKRRRGRPLGWKKTSTTISGHSAPASASVREMSMIPADAHLQVFVVSPRTQRDLEAFNALAKALSLSSQVISFAGMSSSRPSS